jgi:beta-lactamase superfamily II metal-dependent hydrolase
LGAPTSRPPLRWEGNLADLHLIFLDSGQGDCTIVLFPDSKTAWIVDCGSIKNGDTVKSEINSVLLKQVLGAGYSDIDTLIITHPDQDHFNLLSVVVPSMTLFGMKIKRILFSGLLEHYLNKVDKEPGSDTSDYTHDLIEKFKGNNQASTPTIGKSKDYGGATATFLSVNAGDKDNKKKANDNSIVVLIEYNGVKIFLMGDAEAAAEKAILAYWKSKNPGKLAPGKLATILKAGHHGSHTASSSEFIGVVKPTHLMISADTRYFGRAPCGMPRLGHLEGIQKAAGGSFADVPSKFKHSYVAFQDDSTHADFGKPVQMAATTKAICTTLYKLDYSSGSEYESTGGSWHLWVNDTGFWVGNTWGG